MKLPQLEDGYTRVNNQILDAWIRCKKIPPEIRIQMYVARRSWGYGRATADLRPKDFVKACGIRHNNIHRDIKKAIAAKLIHTIHADGISGVRYKLSKKYEKWFIPSTRMLPSTQRKNTIHVDGTLISIKKRKKRNTITREFYFKRRVALPSGFHLTDKMRAKAIEIGVTEDRLDYVFKYFCDHHIAKGTTNKDWVAAWRNWCRNDLKFNKQPEDAFDVVKRQLEEGRSDTKTGKVPEQAT